MQPLNNPLNQVMKQAFEEIDNRRDIILDAAKIQKENSAEKIASLLYEEIIRYQNSLSDSEDVAIQLVQFGQNATILVERIGYVGSTMISFHGTDMNGKPLELIQHISQLSFLLEVVAKPEPESPKRMIGFERHDT